MLTKDYWARNIDLTQCSAKFSVLLLFLHKHKQWKIFLIPKNNTSVNFQGLLILGQYTVNWLSNNPAQYARQRHLQDSFYFFEHIYFLLYSFLLLTATRLFISFLNNGLKALTDLEPVSSHTSRVKIFVKDTARFTTGKQFHPASHTKTSLLGKFRIYPLL